MSSWKSRDTNVTNFKTLPKNSLNNKNALHYVNDIGVNDMGVNDIGVNHIGVNDIGVNDINNINLDDIINLDDTLKIINKKSIINKSVDVNIAIDLLKLYESKEITVEQIIEKYTSLEYNYNILLANNNRLINNLDNPSVDILYNKYMNKLYERE
jgi:hypothetical protein